MDLEDWCAKQGFPLDGNMIGLLASFEADLYDCNQVMNLTRVPHQDFIQRHIKDSLQIVPLIPKGARLLDIGTGPGFPAWPLALARPDIDVTAVDGSERPLRFLRRHPLPNLAVFQGRAEELDQRDAFDFVTGRAVAPFALQMEVSAAWVKPGGLLVPFRTAHERIEIEKFPCSMLGLTLRSMTGEGNALYPVFCKTGTTPAAYPRPWSQAKKAPLSTSLQSR